jgi:hypothetical protein
MSIRIDKIIRVTPGKLHCWVETPAGIIKKPCKSVPQDLWDIFEGRREAPVIKVADEEEPLKRTTVVPPMPILMTDYDKIKGFKKLWLKLKEMFWKIFGMKR